MGMTVWRGAHRSVWLVGSRLGVSVNRREKWEISLGQVGLSRVLVWQSTFGETHTPQGLKDRLRGEGGVVTLCPPARGIVSLQSSPSLRG